MCYRIYCTFSDRISTDNQVGRQNYYVGPQHMFSAGQYECSVERRWNWNRVRETMIGNVD